MLSIEAQCEFDTRVKDINKEINKTITIIKKKVREVIEDMFGYVKEQERIEQVYIEEYFASRKYIFRTEKLIFIVDVERESIAMREQNKFEDSWKIIRLIII